MNSNVTKEPEEQLGEIFGSYRAEWLSERIYELFTAPSYFPEMKAAAACVLEGGRGTGKTTVLRGLSYEGQYALCRNDQASFKAIDFIGVYLRIDTNVVTAFDGQEVTKQKWVRLFAHYFNLIACLELITFTCWYSATIGDEVQIAPNALRSLATALHLAQPEDTRSLLDAIQHSIISFEAYINNVGDAASNPLLSLQGAPIRIIAQALRATPQLQNKRFFILVDEYENLLEYQQQVVNTLIKHGAPGLTYKIAMRELGWKCRTTLNPDEQLRSPADYVRINIGEKLEGVIFRDFALKICNDRVRRLNVQGIVPSTSIDQLLPALSEEDEAILLAGEKAVEQLRQTYSKLVDERWSAMVAQLSATELLLIRFWAQTTSAMERDVLHDRMAHPSTWNNRHINYSHAVLFTLRKGKRGIRKYYAGWDTFIQLANGNIRFLLALVDQCLHLHFRSQHGLTQTIEPAVQTKAAQLVGKSNLAELEGLSVYGARLTRLLLGLGRVFGVFAAQVAGHAPEQTQFEITDESGEPHEDVDDLLRAAVMHLAIVRPLGTKPTDDADTKDYDYMIHPIFCPFFEFSYRKKRKIHLTPEDIRSLVLQPAKAIGAILGRYQRHEDSSLPEQLSLFRQFYNDHNR